MELDLPTVINTMACGVYVCDAAGEIVAANTVALAEVGAKSVAELRQSGPKPFHFPHVRSEDGKTIPPECLPFYRALAGEEVVYEMELVDSPSGTLMLRTRTAPMRDSAGKIIGAVKLTMDVTKEYELGHVKDEFVRQAAHELKTPVAVIKANAQALEIASSQPQLQALLRGVDRIDGLINSLLDLLDLQGGFFSFSRLPVPLDRLIDAAIARLSARAARRVQVESPPTIVVQCDETRMRRAIYSILDNALKYSPSDSTVEISVTTVDHRAHLEIRDHGVGIPRDKQAHVFEKFFRAHAGTPNDAGGIGVGLFVARAIIVQHGGRIWFDSEEGRGTVFYVELPIDAETT